MANLRQTPLTCSGHTRPVVHLDFSEITESSYFLISACKGKNPLSFQLLMLIRHLKDFLTFCPDMYNTLASIFIQNSAPHEVVDL